MHFSKNTFVIIVLINLYFVQCKQPTSRSLQARQTTTTSVPSIVVQEHSIKDDKDPEKAKFMDPITRLYQIQARKHQMEPIFKEIGQKNFRNQKNHIIRREFNIEVEIDNITAGASGFSKKSAKRKAAIAMLRRMGLDVEVDV